MLNRRFLLLALPLGACATMGDDQEPLPPLVTGYGHLTPIRLNVASIDVPTPSPGSVRVDEPAPLRPDAEMRRMAEERLSAAGTAGQARFFILAAEFRRERTGSGGLFAGEPGERLNIRLRCRLEIFGVDGERAGFIEAEARRMRTVPSGAGIAARRRAAEDAMRQAMEELNIEFEFQVRRALRAWLLEAAPATLGPGGIEREDLPRS
jgi:hypothetical protein